jgi:AcrR family transcriptional regulator
LRHPAADIIAGVGTTPQVLNSPFLTKRDLFAACYRFYLDASMAEIEPHADGETDLGAHHVWRMLGDTALQALNHRRAHAT